MDTNTVSTLNAIQMIQTFSSQIPQIISLVTAILYVLGMYIIVRSIMSMRRAAFLHSPGQGEESVWDCIKHVFVGAALLYLPSTIDVATASLFYDTVPYAYDTDDDQGFNIVWDALLKVCLLIGIVAVGKGIYTLGYGKGENTQNNGHVGPFAKGLTYIISGTCLINLPLFLEVIAASIGVSGILN